jgi:hypothetical protein
MYDPVKEKARRERRRQENPDLFKAYNAKWRAANREQINAEGRERKRRNFHIVRVKNAEYRQRHKEQIDESNKRYRENNRKKMCEASDRWRRANPGKVNARTAKRTAAKLQATPPWVDLKQIRAFYIEAARLTAETGVPHEVDHIYPLQGKTSCGLHVPWNLRVVHRSINRSKQNKMPEIEASFS